MTDEELNELREHYDNTDTTEELQKAHRVDPS